MYSRYNIPEADWKLLRRVHRVAVERFSDQTLAEAQRLIQDGARSAHQRYLDLYKLIEQRDEQMARLFDTETVGGRAYAGAAARRRLAAR